MMIKLRRMRGVGHVARMVGLKINTKLSSENLKGKDHAEV